jgi:hydroxyacylglutathione hydrolase
MYFQRYYLGCLSHASYLIGDEQTGIAAVVDPQRDIEQYVVEAKSKGFEIKYVLLTHFHADFIAGHIEMRDQLGAKIYLGARAQADFDFTPVKDGDVIEFGQVRLSILETPGHTPEGISILVYDLAFQPEAPVSVLTGDTLFIGDVGRPDLLASIGVTADELAEMLYDSLHQKLMKLPAETKVYPAHGAGSMCGKNLSDQASSTIGEQLKYNYALQDMSLKDFKAIVTAQQPEAPAYFAHDAVLNRQERPSLDETLKSSLVGLNLEQVLEQQAAGAQVLDVRSEVDFASGYLEGSLNIPLQGKYATWCGTVLDKERPMVIVAELGAEEEAVMRLGRIGFDQVVGFLEGGEETLQANPQRIRQVRRVTAQALADELQSGQPITIVDIRTPAEYGNGHIEGSINLPLNQLAQRFSEIPRDGQVVIHCQGGYRSSIGTSLLQREGFDNLLDLVGGFQAWSASHLPVEMPHETSSCHAKA